VLQDFNIKAYLLLLCVSLASISGLHFGLADIAISLIDAGKREQVDAIIKGDLSSSITHTNQATTIDCSLSSLSEFDFCGIGFNLGEKGRENGIDLSAYDSITVTLQYSAPITSAKLKVILRNFNEQYSLLEDNVSLKFNTILLNPNLHQATVSIPLSAFQVEAWWTDMYKVGFENSQIELSNVSLFELISEDMPVTGDYQISVQNATLHGQLISETELLKVILLLWLLCTILLVTLQSNKLQKISMTDPLTGLYNRRGIKIWINKYLSSRHSCQSLAMIYIDIDDFKKVNDTYGHMVGDELLIAFSDRVRKLPYIKGNSSFAFSRLSGDEFTLLCNSQDDSNLKSIANRLLAALKQPIKLGKQEIHINVSIGIAQADNTIKSFEDLLIRADSAMYYAKKSGKNQYKIFNESISKNILFRKQTAENIKNAIIQDQFHLHYMPILDSKTLETVSVELLLRCHAESLRGIGPDIFIPIAEEYDLIKNIDLWVIEACFKQMAMEQSFLADSPVQFCINISAAELHNPRFSKQLQVLIDLYQINPASIELEITETSLVETDEMSIQTLQDIRSMGLKLALDDFGTGYTAFSQLINYPVNCLKIDKSFIDDLDAINDLDATDNTRATMIRAIIAIAKSYQLTTIAEGIETASQYHFLSQLGCDMMQGYLFSKPVPWNDFKKILTETDHSLQKQLLTNNSLHKYQLSHSHQI